MVFIFRIGTNDKQKHYENLKNSGLISSGMREVTIKTPVLRPGLSAYLLLPGDLFNKFDIEIVG